MPTFTLSRRAVISTALVATAAVAVPSVLATSNAQPANKAVAAGAALADVTPTPTTPILTANFKTSKPEDLLLSVSLECSILTDVFVQGGGPATEGVKESMGQASAAIKVWLTLDSNNSETNIIPIEDVSAPPQDPGAFGGESDKVTFCDRVHQRTITDAENSSDGVDSERDYMRTKSANAFNWVRLNAGSGDHFVNVWAELLKPSPNASGANSPESSSDGFVGNRTLVIEPTKLANNAVIGISGSG